MPGTLGSYHANVNRGWRYNLSVVNVETVGKHQRLAGPHEFLKRLPVYDRVQVVGDKHYHYVGLLGHFARGGHLKAGFLGGLPCLTSRRLGHQHFTAAVLQVVGMCVALAPIADNTNLLPLEQVQVGIPVIVDVGHGSSFADEIARSA